MNVTGFQWMSGLLDFITFSNQPLISLFLQNLLFGAGYPSKQLSEFCLW